MFTLTHLPVFGGNRGLLDGFLVVGGVGRSLFQTTREGKDIVNCGLAMRHSVRGQVSMAAEIV